MTTEPVRTGWLVLHDGSAARTAFGPFQDYDDARSCYLDVSDKGARPNWTIVGLTEYLPVVEDDA